LAFKKVRKQEMQSQYDVWLKKSQAVFLLEYSRMSMKEIDGLRGKVREAGGQVHVTKNTLMRRALSDAGIQDLKVLEGTTLSSFAFGDAPTLAKVMMDVTKNSDFFKVKGGYLDGRFITPEQVKALADMPPLPVMRATLLDCTPSGRLCPTVVLRGRSFRKNCS